MDSMQLPQDFKEFLQLLNSHEVEYLVVGGYAVAYHGYPRPTGDIDIWIASTPNNAQRLLRVFVEFGFDLPNLSAELFLKEKQIVRIGVPPVRIEVLTNISGVEFDDCYRMHTADEVDGIPISLISLDDLKANKQAAGRHKDLDDLENLSD